MEDEEGQILNVDLSRLDTVKHFYPIGSLTLKDVARIHYIIEERHKPIFQLDDSEYRVKFWETYRVLLFDREFKQQFPKALLIGVMLDEQMVVSQEVCREAIDEPRVEILPQVSVIDTAQKPLTQFV